ncbi:MAG: tail fiber domain-containing protein [Gammaproteobacteria bacterium]|nr:tail fiber domain-containing protein [Gammaproteobacteria bacterium]
MSFVGDMIFGNDDAANASRDAANVAAKAEQNKLDYLKKVNALPQQYKESALKQLNDIYSQDPTKNPMYQAQLANINQMGNQATELSLANNAATGGLRSGNQQQAFQDIAIQQNLAQNNALADAYGQKMQGLSGLANINSGTNQIANSMGQMGMLQAQGITGAAQAAQQASQNQFNNLAQLGGLGLMAFSDERLKDNLVKVGKTSHPSINKYTWTWNDKAKKLDLSGNDEGYLAQEVEKVFPDLVGDNGEFKFINYNALEERLNG